MSEQVERCPDGHHCLNGSKCVDNPFDEGSYYCDCREEDFEARYEGLKCEHRAEVYCVAEGATRHSFCTNGGKCVEFVTPEEAHIGCQCPPEYEGSHCQFVKGTKPKDWPYSSLQGSSQGEKHYSNAGAIAGTIVVVLATGIVLLAFVYQRYFSVRENYDDVRGKESELDCDGSDMKDAVAEQSRVSSTTRSRGKTRKPKGKSRDNKTKTDVDERKSITGNIV